LDGTDVRIFCEMAFKYLDYNTFARRHISPSEIGSKLGLDEKTVRTRVTKMEEGGFIQYYQAIPNLSLFGLNSIDLYSFEAADVQSKQEALAYVRRASAVVEAFDMVGPGFFASLAGSTERDVSQTVDRFTDDLKLRTSMKVGGRAWTSPTKEPNRLGWQLLRRLRYDALAPAREVARALSITPRMAEYRISTLLDSGAFFIRAVLNPQQQRGLIFYGLIVWVDAGARSSVVGKLQDAFGPKIWSLYTPATEVIIANLFGFATGEPEDAVLSTLKLDGVRHCSFSLFKEMLETERPNWLDRLIDERIGSASRRRPRG